MKPSAPPWWYAKQSIWPTLLTPAALLWDAVTRARWALTKPYRSKVPVICIGNFTAGGAGKTPVAIAIAHILLSAGESPIFLSRGYGGTVKEAHLVYPSLDKAQTVGDEPLLLAQVAPTIVTADRAEGATLAERQGASVIIMDDGFQNPGLIKSLSFIVIDGELGLGNEHVIPAGPLRANLGSQLARADGFIQVGKGKAEERISSLAQEASLPILRAEIVPDREFAWLKNKPVVVFAGIGNPEKFFRLVENLGGKIAARFPFRDHHNYTRQDALKLLDTAARMDATLVTTQKDLVRIEGVGELQKLKAAARALPVSIQFNDMGKMTQMLAQTLKSS